jgi:4-diphosphocytidyl-2-C-methyl-D-erythritol kinase
VIPGVTVRVPAKINVQLSVGGPQPTGFHELATIFLTVGLYDEITVTASKALRITASGPGAEQVPADGTNLAARAATALARRLGIRPDVGIHIAKDIPVAGGMAGGSADAAGALLACAQLWGADLDDGELLDVAAELGSDVPFCLMGGAALGLGRGERLEALPVGGAFHWVIAVADGGLSTPAVYRECDRLRESTGTGSSAAGAPAPRPSPALIKALAEGNVGALARALDEHGHKHGHANDLQPAALFLRPALAGTLRAGRSAGSLADFVSGSGPTCVFLAEDAPAAQRIATALAASGSCSAARVARSPAEGPAVVGAARPPVARQGSAGA